MISRVYSIDRISPREEALGRPLIWSLDRLTSFLAVWMYLPPNFENFLPARTNNIDDNLAICSLSNFGLRRDSRTHIRTGCERG